jgi:hypothetical protein
MPDASPLELALRVDPQPDEETCGPTALHAVYRYHGDAVDHTRVCEEVPRLPSGGTLSVFLALHALGRGYRTTIYTCNVKLFDPTWFEAAGLEMPRDGHPSAFEDGAVRPILRMQDKLRQQHAAKGGGRGGGRLKRATDAYCEYLDRGGRLLMQDITLELLSRHLRQGRPIVAGLSATWLYRAMRERESDWQDDDVAGEPLGHFVVLHGIDEAARRVSIADPYRQVPYPGSHHYSVDADRLIGAIYLGIVTYDAKLLIVEPAGGRE